MNKFIILLVCFGLAACDQEYFSEPQPVNTKNITTTPSKIRGTWVFHGTDNDVKIDTITIGKRYYQWVTWDSITESGQKLKADSSTYFAGNKIYNRGEDGELEGGYSYRLNADSITIYLQDLKIVDLGRNAFFRKFDYGYILNVRHEKMHDWWELTFIDMRKKDSFTAWRIRDKDMALDNKHKKLHKEISHYYIVRWTVDEMKAFIDKGGFSKELFSAKYKDRIK